MENSRNYLEGDGMEVDLREMFFLLLDKWKLILMSGLLLALLSLSYSKFMVPERFESATSIYILNQQIENMTTYNDLQTGSILTQDYEVLVKGRTVLEGTIKRLGLNLTYEELSKMVSVNVPASTRIVEIKVRTTDPYLSKDIADTIREISSQNISEIMGVDAVNVVERANLPEKKCSPNVVRNTILGGMFGGIFACAVILISYLFNDAIRTPDDVEYHLGLSTLGIIPLEDSMEANRKKHKKIKGSGRRAFRLQKKVRKK